MDDSVVIVKGGAADVCAVMGMVQACVRQMIAQGIHQWDDVYPDRGTIERDIAEQTLFVARDGQALCGMIVVDENQSAEYVQVTWQYVAEKVLVVHRLAVAPTWQGRGLASRLMSFAEDYGRRYGYGAIRLDTFVHNPTALGLYTKRQYRRAGTVRFRKGEFYCLEKSLKPEETNR